MIDIIFLGIWMLLIVFDLWKIRNDIWSIRKRLDKLEEKSEG